MLGRRWHGSGIPVSQLLQRINSNWIKDQITKTETICKLAGFASCDTKDQTEEG